MSDDEVAQYYAYEKYKSASESEEDSDMEDVEKEVNSEAVARPDRLVDRRCLPNIDGTRVVALRDICLTYDVWPGYQIDMTKYGVCKTTLSKLRGAVRNLHEGEVEGVTWENFMETFGSEELMQMMLKTNKVDSTKDVVAIFQRHKSYSRTPHVTGGSAPDI